ncbi:MAG: Sec-independent protein translocase protein TatB, partial [Candidatus Binatia bacterium]
MFLFIFESIGTQELLLIGIVALIFLGPRRMPEMARKLGKLMSDFRNMTSDFKSTWEREVNFEDEERAIKTGEPPPPPPARPQNDTMPAIPEIKEIDAEQVKSMFPQTEQAQLP